MTLHRVDGESVAEQAGLQVGDLILDVNGTSFESIPHQEAVDFVKSQQHIIMTVKVGLTSLWLARYFLHSNVYFSLKFLGYIHDCVCVFSQLEYYLQPNYFIQMLVGYIQMEQKQMVCK